VMSVHAAPHMPSRVSLYLRPVDFDVRDMAGAPR
jgi:hypothetical protein